MPRWYQPDVQTRRYKPSGPCRIHGSRIKWLLAVGPSILAPISGLRKILLAPPMGVKLRPSADSARCSPSPLPRKYEKRNGPFSGETGSGSGLIEAMSAGLEAGAEV